MRFDERRNRQKYVREEIVCFVYLNKDRQLLLEIIVRIIVGGYLELLWFKLDLCYIVLKQYQEENGDVMLIIYVY